MKECVYVDKEEIRAIIADHFGVDLTEEERHDDTGRIS